MPTSHSLDEFIARKAAELADQLRAAAAMADKEEEIRIEAERQLAFIEYDANRERCPYDEGELCQKILTNVVGFDLNPLAVMAARTNYLIGVRDLLGHVASVEIPVYLCDSIVTPTEYGDLFVGPDKVARIPCAACRPPHLMVPKEIAQTTELVARYASTIEHAHVHSRLRR